VGSVYTEYFRTGRLPEPHTYKVEGIGEDFLPGTMDFTFVDEVVQVTDRESFMMTRRLVREEGIMCGGSSGTAVAGAVKYLRGLPDHGEGKRAVIILPDSGLRYLSKIFSDDWMREHGFLEVELGTVSDLLRAKGLPLVTAAPPDPVKDVVAKMKRYDVSQLPVVSDGALVGIITEVDLLSYLLEGGGGLEDPVTSIVDPAPPVVSPDTPVGDLAEVFLNASAAVVVDGGRVSGIITKIDVIDHLAKKLGR
jgi:cystathionine beta-synthase